MTEYSRTGSLRPLASPGPGSRDGSQQRSFRLDLSRQAPLKTVRRAGTGLCLCVCVSSGLREPPALSLACSIMLRLGACSGRSP